ncbi:hypothetical protein GCM10010250_69680 [Streptomyces althioticus]|nr:hypothetical protein GCM10010250_69680 [Streptomyces althioticus]
MAGRRRGGAAARCRRWHYEIAALDTGEGGGVTGHTIRRTVGADFESNHLSGTAIALRPTAYPLAGSERLWPHQAIVRDILADCEGMVVWGGDLDPVRVSHLHIAARLGDSALAPSHGATRPRPGHRGADPDRRHGRRPGHPIPPRQRPPPAPGSGRVSRAEG